MVLEDDYMDLNKELAFDNQVIFISGTPCTGKTTIATELNDYLNNIGCDSTLIKINDLAARKDLIVGEDPDKLYKVIDIEGLNDVLEDEIAEFKSEAMDSNVPKALIVEGHLSHLCEGADKMIVLRLNPSSLKSRLEARDYVESKVNENLEAEALAVCSAEAYELYDNELNEIDTTDKSIDDVLSVVIDIINGKEHYPVGDVDFMDWFLS